MLLLIQQFLSHYKIQEYTLLTAMMATVIDRVLYRQLYERSLRVKKPWSFRNKLTNLISIVVWTAFFLELVGWQPAAVIVIIPVLLVANRILTFYMFFILGSWHTLRSLMGFLFAVSLLIVFRHGLVFPPNISDAILKIAGILVEIYAAYILVLLGLVRFRKLDPNDREMAASIRNTGTPPNFSGIRGFFWYISLHIFLFGYEVFGKYFLGGGALLEKCFVRVLRYMGA